MGDHKEIGHVSYCRVLLHWEVGLTRTARVAKVGARSTPTKLQL